MDDFGIQGFEETDKYKCLQLLLLRCLHQSTHDFRIIYHDTDNFHLILEDNEDFCVINFPFTPEHTPIQEHDFRDEGEFSLNRCADIISSYETVRTKINYFIFTNRPMVKLKFFVPHIGKYKFLSFTTLYNVNLSNDGPSIFIDQVPTDLNVSIRETFEKLTSQYSIHCTNPLVIQERFYFYLRYNLVHNLTKTNVTLALLDFFISRYKVDLSYSTQCQFNDLWSDITCDKLLVVVDSDYDTDSFLKGHTASTVAKFGETSELDYKNLWFKNQVSLLVRAQKSEDCDDIENILKMFNVKLKVTVLSNRSTNHGTMCSLKDAQIKALLKCTINLQGKFSTTLDQIVEETNLQSLKYSDIIRLITNNFIIDYCYKKLPPYFIERYFLKTILRFEILKELKDEVFVIKNKTGSANILLTSLENFNLPNIYIVDDAEEEVIEKAITKNVPVHFVNFDGENWLEWINSWGCIENIKKYNMSEEIRITHTVEKLVEEKRNTHLLVIDELMGRSTLLDCIALHVQDEWVITIQLDHDISYYTSPSSKSALDHLRHFYKPEGDSELAQKLLESFAHMKKIHILLDGYDQVPVSCVSNVIDIINCFKNEGFHIWLIVSTRDVSNLENHLNTIPTIVRPLNVRDQKEFLGRYLEHLTNSNDNITEFVETLLKVVRKEVDTILEFPLYLRFIANIYIDELKHLRLTGVLRVQDNFDLLLLMEKFMDEYVNWLVEKYDDSVRKLVRECFPLLALQFVFDKNDLRYLDINKKCTNLHVFVKERILTEDGTNVNFAHPIFAHYLAAKWIYENLRSSNRSVRSVIVVLHKRRFFDFDRYKDVFKMLDYMLAKGNALHTALIKGRFNQVDLALTSQPDCLSETDAGGRNIVHIAASYGIFHPKIEHNLPIDTEDNMVKIVMMSDLKAIEAEDTLLGFSTLDYALGTGCLAVANAICEKSPHLIPNIYIALPQLELYYGYCIRINRYKHLYKTLLKYSICLNVTTKALRQNSRVESISETSFNELTEESFQNYVRSFNASILNHLMESLELKKEDSKYYNNIHLAAAFGTKQNILELLKEGAKINNLHNYSHTPLHAAVMHENVNNIDTLLAAGAKINIVDVSGNTALHLACQCASTTIVKKLIKRGADISIQNDDGDTPFHHALKQSKEQNAEMFLPDKHYELFLSPETSISCDRCLDINMQNKEGDTPLLLALQNKCPYIVRELLEYHADVNISNHTKNTCLHYAVQADNYNTVLELIYCCVNINATNDKGDTPVSVALNLRYINIAQLLISKGAIVTNSDETGTTCVHYAAKTGLNNLIETVLDNGADINKQNVDGETPLSMSIVERHLNSSFYLISKGADPNLIDKNGSSCLHHAAMQGYPKLVTDLLGMGCNINQKNVDGETPLVMALTYDRVIVAKLLLNSGADATVIDKNGYSCLHLAVRIPSLDLVKKCLEIGLDINILDNDGNTALHLAIQRHYKEICKLLIASGADIDIADRSGFSCMHYAVQSSLDDIILALVHKGADINKETLRGESPLLLHIQNTYSQCDTTKILVDNGADVNKIDSRSGNSCLHFAAESTECVVIEFLLTTGVNINLQNNDGDTPLHLAVRRGHCGITELLLSKGADITIMENRNRNTCLHSAVISNQNDIVTALIKQGADINAVNTDDETPISVAERLGYSSILKLLMPKTSTVKYHSLLFSAVKNGEIHTVKNLLKEGFDINRQDTEGNTPILLAIQYNQIGMADFLLSQGADITIVSHNGTTCLHNAAYGGDFHITYQLLEKGCEIDAVNVDGETSLQFAITSRHIHIARLLLDRKAKIDLVPSTNSRGSCLHCACEENADDIVDIILQSDFNIDKLNKYGSTPLIEAISRKRRQIAIKLIEAGADINAENDSAWSCLLYACSNQCLEIINILIDKGVDVNKSFGTYFTPLSDAISSERRATALLLISKGVNVHSTCNWGNYPLHMAAASGMDEVVNIILDQGFDINKKNSDDYTPLYNAITSQNFSTAQLLIARGASIHYLNWNFSTYLHIAIDNGYEELVIKLIKDGINIHHQNNDSYTPMSCAENGNHVNITKLLFTTIIAEGYKDDNLYYLHNAAQFGDNKIVTSLLNIGYDINKQNVNGETPLIIALKYDKFYTAKLLISKGADYNIQAERITPCLHYFAQLGWNDLILKMIEDGFDVNAKTGDGETALFMATKHKHVSTIKLLLSKGADLSILSHYDQTAIHYAIDANSKPVLEAILENIDINKFKKEIKAVMFTCLEYSYIDLAEILIKYTVDDLKRDSGENMLLSSVSKQYQGLVLELLQKYGNVNEANSDGDTPILLALVSGDEQMIQLLLEHGADVNITNKKGNSCLHYATRNSEEILTLILEKGCNLDLKNCDGLTPLLFALEETYTTSAQLLIAYGANAHIEDSIGSNSVHYAAKIGAEDLMKYLIENGLDVNKKNDEGDDCLDLAINRGYIGIIKLLLNHGMDVHRVNRFGENCLLKAIEEDNDEFVNELLEKGVDVDVQCDRGYTPFTMALWNSKTNYAKYLLDKNADVRLRNKSSSNLHFAISQNVDVIEQLLDLGLNIDEQDAVGNTPLLHALESGSIENINLLLKKGANIHIRNNEGNSCLHYAIESSTHEVLSDLLSRGADLTKRNVSGETPLLKALKDEKLQHAKVLFDNGADCKVYDNDGNSCLHYAAKFGFDELVTHFISNGADINHETFDGFNPFLTAIENHKTSTAKLLVNSGADIRCQTAQRMSWVSYLDSCTDTEINGYIEIIDMILSKGFDIDYRSSRCQTILLIALKSQYRAMVDFLLAKGANIHQNCYDSGSSCLHYAAQAGYDDLVADFLDKGLDIDRENNSRETSLRIAFVNKHCSTVQLLLSRGASVDDGNFLHTYTHYAVELGDESILIELINKGADLNRVNADKKTPLMLALESENTSVAKLLQEKGVDSEASIIPKT